MYSSSLSAKDFFCLAALAAAIAAACSAACSALLSLRKICGGGLEMYSSFVIAFAVPFSFPDDVEDVLDSPGANKLAGKLRFCTIGWACGV